mmetsp:Transcript_27602/g.91659  ORF Transcript_27602/g.91659 Transcript_27602/m.91659 type:complete len:202 (+) Transcript_27602:2018-2623(+)
MQCRQQIDLNYAALQKCTLRVRRPDHHFVEQSIPEEEAEKMKTHRAAQGDEHNAPPSELVHSPRAAHYHVWINVSEHFGDERSLLEVGTRQSVGYCMLLLLLSHTQLLGRLLVTDLGIGSGRAHPFHTHCRQHCLCGTPKPAKMPHPRLVKPGNTNTPRRSCNTVVPIASVGIRTILHICHGDKCLRGLAWTMGPRHPSTP